MSKESQGAYEERAAIQTYIIECSTHSEEEIIPWIENHGRNFELFFDSISPEMRLKWAEAVHAEDEHKKNELIHAFTAYEAGVQDPEAFLH